MNTTTKVIIGITVAAAAGAALGMLFAPEKGTDLRKKIKDGAKNLADDFSTLLMTGRELVADVQERFIASADESGEMVDTNSALKH